MHKILILDDQPVIADSALSLLRDEFLVISARTGAQMRQQLAQGGFACVVVDIDLRGTQNGIDLLPEIKAAGIPIIINSGTWDVVSARACLAIGIHAFVDKGKETVCLLNAVRAVVAGDTAIPPDIIASVYTDKHDYLPTLTRGEQKVLARITLFPTHPQATIAASLHLAPGTVKNILASLTEKFGIRGKPALIKEARRRGYRPPPPPPPIDA